MTQSHEKRIDGMTTKQTFFGLLPEEVKETCKDRGIPSFIGDQVLHWVYNKNILDPAKMRNIAKKNQEIIAEIFDFSLFKSVSSLMSHEENAVKNNCVLFDNNIVECVVLKEKKYNTLCISSQCGCPVDCKFCLTGVIGFKRQLTAHEIVAQVVYSHSIGYAITNIVFMGMGEPLLNYENVFKSIDILTHPKTYNISKRNITVSTSGYMAGVERLIKDERFVNLAFSVGMADPLRREQIMPTEKRNPILTFIKVVKEYQSMHNRKLTLEYTLLENVNDSEFDIKSLINLSKYLNAKINLINLNPHPKIPYKPISVKKLHQIRDKIKKEKCPVTVRYKKGQDISAACGQLGESYL
ncbi:hypothetical protein DID78_03875 [Candidatus Marinamargulisbacteria bacterium SCGC AG-343-D04]|nr:hypothetical protein DID78_03875 [Candidatus Marinamargulisbacteria bacterium SCGC AG-343-D04]